MSMKEYSLTTIIVTINKKTREDVTISVAMNNVIRSKKERIKSKMKMRKLIFLRWQLQSLAYTKHMDCHFAQHPYQNRERSHVAKIKKYVMQISPRNVSGGGGILDLCYVASSGLDVVYIGMAKKG